MKRTVKWIIKGSVLVLVIAGLVFAHSRVSALAALVIERRAELDQKPDEELRAATLRSELSRRAFDLNRIRTYVVPRDQIIDVVSAIEAEGQRFGVTVQVPDIQEEPVFDEAGNPIAPPGPLQDVQAKIIAVGPPDRLVAFLHSMDHLPYILRVTRWNLSLDRSALSSSSSISVPGSEEAAVALEGFLESDVMITVGVNTP